MLQLIPVPLLSQHKGVPLSIEQVGALSASTHPVILQLEQTTCPPTPLEQTQLPTPPDVCASAICEGIILISKFKPGI